MKMMTGNQSFSCVFLARMTMISSKSDKAIRVPTVELLCVCLCLLFYFQELTNASSNKIFTNVFVYCAYILISSRKCLALSSMCIIHKIQRIYVCVSCSHLNMKHFIFFHTCSCYFEFATFLFVSPV